MLIRIGFDIAFESAAPTPMIAALYPHASQHALLRSPYRIVTQPETPIGLYTDAFGNHCGRLIAPAGQLRLLANGVIENSGLPDPVVPDAAGIPVEQLPVDTLTFLSGSRYVDSDRLMSEAWSLFGGTAPGWSRVQAICDWVHDNIRFGYAYARPDKTARETFDERAGVCRDFAHLSIAFCRCMNIPARYAAGYLGDIGVPRDPAPMDFSGWFEAFVGGEWFTFDARHNVPRIGRVLMVRGRDAADAALTTSFGNARLTRFEVWTHEVAQDLALA